MTRRIVVVGAGGFGRETLDVIEAINEHASIPAFEIVGVLDDQPSGDNLHRLAARGAVFLGSVGSWIRSGANAEFVVGVGDPSARAAIARQLEAAGCLAATLVHPSALLGSACELGSGVVVCAGSITSTNVRLGRHVHLNPGVTIGHDTVLEDYVSVNPGAVVSGEVMIRHGVLIGAGAIVLQGLTVGSSSVLGAGACVVRDVDPGATVKGVPAR